LKLANHVRRRQLEDGGLNIYFGGPSELNANQGVRRLAAGGDATECGHLQPAVSASMNLAA
jgi:hypothetical protein